MSNNRVEITLSDPREPGTSFFANLVDPSNLSIFIERVKSTSEKKSIEELVLDLLEGR